MSDVATTIDADASQGAPRRATWRFMFGHPARVMALGLGSGLLPKAPGTFGTLAAWLAFLALDPWFGDAAWGAVIAMSLLLGVAACTRCAQDMAVADPSAVVWDEVVAFWIVLWLIVPAGWLEQTLAFALFRFFDAVKPGPVAWADALFKRRSGEAIGWRQGVGIMLDDLVAALCALLVMVLLQPWMR